MAGGAMEPVNMDNGEIEIDVNKYIAVVAKHKKMCIVLFLLILAVGFAVVQFFPEIYRISMLIQPPVSGELLTGAHDLEFAENLKSLIVNKAFHEKLGERLKPALNIDALKFDVVIPEKTNILQVSIDLESREKEFGVVLLRNLYELLSDVCAERIEIRTNTIVNRIKQKEIAVEKARNLQDQINAIADREDKLREEMKTITALLAKILAENAGLKNNAGAENPSDLLRLNLIQSNLNYSNQLNSQCRELSIRGDSLRREAKTIDARINDFQTAIDTLNANKGFISNLRIISRPKVSPHPVRNPHKNKVLALSAVIGLFFGVIAAYLREFQAHALKKDRAQEFVSLAKAAC